MNIPPAYQEAAPFGCNLGGANPAFISIVPTAAYDSWLTIGITEGDDAGELSSVGLDWNTWTDSNGLSSNNGALFFMDPTHAARRGRGTFEVVIGQLTVASGSFEATINVQGNPGLHTPGQIY